VVAELPAEHADFCTIKGSDFGPGRRAALKYVADLVLGHFLRARKAPSSWEITMTFPRRRFLHIAAGAGALPLISRIAWAESYPTRPIHLIVGFTPGAAADVTGRLLGESMGPLLGQQIAVENKPGGGSSIAADYVAHAANDGYTLFLATLSIIVNQIINPNAAFDMQRDLAPIALLSRGAVVLVVNPDSDIHSVADLIALAKAKPGQVAKHCGWVGQTGASDSPLGGWNFGFGNGPHRSNATSPFVQMGRPVSAARFEGASGWQTHRSPAGLSPPKSRCTWSRSPANGRMTLAVRCRTGIARSWLGN
jgi:hypothetical protein